MKIKKLLLLGFIELVFLTNAWSAWSEVKVFYPDGSLKDTYATIQEGINACDEGGTVSVSPGTYNEAIYIDKGIALIGSETPTIIAPTSRLDTIRLSGAPTDNALISGFIIKGGWYGIYCSNGSPTITNNTISGNCDGIVCDFFSSPTITNNTISGNDYGIVYYSSSPTITNNIISGNGWGGIVCDSSFPTITNNIISGNGWVGISCEGSSPTITNNTISGNNYGIVCYSSSPTITNNTISGNNWDGIYCDDESSPKITNNIITENGTQSSEYYGIYNSEGTPTINYNCVWGNGLGGNNNYYNCLPGPNDIQEDPQFIGQGDFRLKPTSPCIDAGTNLAQGLPLIDKDGNPRIINGIVDIGAYEYQEETIGTQTISSLKEEFLRTSTFTNTIISQKYILSANVEGDLNGSLSSNLEIIAVRIGAFSNKGFLKEKFTVTLDGVSYSGNLKGVIYPQGTKTILSGAIKGGLQGTFEGYLIEESYIATWTLHKVGNNWVYCKISISGKLTPQKEEEYLTNLIFSQLSLNGTASGSYNDPLSLVLNYVKINDIDNPYHNQGFAFVSYNSTQGDGKGWLYTENNKMEGLFTNPLFGLADVIFDEQAKEIFLTISTGGVNIITPEPQLEVKIWGPDRVSPGQRISYFVELRNYGLKQAENIAIIASPPTFTEFVSASSNYTYFTIAHWEDIENWETSKVYQVPRIRWDFEKVPAKSVIKLNFQVRVKWGLAGGLKESPDVYIWTIEEADEFYRRYDPDGDHCLQEDYD